MHLLFPFHVWNQHLPSTRFSYWTTYTWINLWLGLSKGIASNVFHDHQRATPVLAQTPQYCRSLSKSSVRPQPLFAYEFKGLVMWFESCWLKHEAHFVNFVCLNFRMVYLAYAHANVLLLTCHWVVSMRFQSHPHLAHCKRFQDTKAQFDVTVAMSIFCIWALWCSG